MKLTIKEQGNIHTLDINKGENLLHSIINNDIHISAACGSNKKCGKCKVKVLSGEFEYKKEELKFINQEERDEMIILACYHDIYSDMSIEIINESNNISAISHYEHIEGIKHKYTIKTISKIDESLDNNKTITEKINDFFKTNYKYSIKALKQLSKLNEYKNISLLIQNDEMIINISNDEIPKVYGYAIDIGTTTVALCLIELISGNIIEKKTFLNPQSKFGADVVSRIQFNNQSKESSKLHKEIISAINTEIIESINRNKIFSENIIELVFSGNTTMIYFLLDMNPNKLAQAPFTVVDADMQKLNYHEVFDNYCLNAQITILPAVSAYVGADIIAGMYQCYFNSVATNLLLIDIGTNGEMAIKRGDKIYCASTAAGPAFEGANITHGIGSIDGAIAEIKRAEDKFEIKTINDKTAIGICGSGLIDIVAEGLNSGDIEDTGYLKHEEYIIYESNNKRISLFPKDVRELQLAKSAIAAGIEVLLSEADLSYEDIDTLYLAGGFGNHVNIDNAIRLGLIPSELREKVKTVGNSSLGGAVHTLLDKNSEDIIYSIKSKVNYIELSSNIKFNEEYVNKMFF